MSLSWIILLFVLALSGVVVIIYNNLVRKKLLMLEGWSGVDVQLKRRADLIPNLVEVVKGYASHESGIFEKVATLRAGISNASNPMQRGEAETMLTGALAGLFAVVENYPELKADKNFLDLQNELSVIEEQIQYARRYYNATVRELNIAIQSFPSNIVAALFHFPPANFFELENQMEKVVPHVAV